METGIAKIVIPATDAVKSARCKEYAWRSEYVKAGVTVVKVESSGTIKVRKEGIELSMSIEEIISQLESLAEHCERMIDKDDPESIWRVDTEALREAVKKLEGELSAKNAAATIRQILEREDVNQKELAEKMGCVRQNVSQTLNRGTVNMRYDSFYRMAKALGYEIILRKI